MLYKVKIFAAINTVQGCSFALGAGSATFVALPCIVPRNISDGYLCLVLTLRAIDIAKMEDTYRTIEAPAEGLYKEKGSKFISLAYPVYSEEEVKEIMADLKKQYYDARHHCYAYILGADRSRFRANDDGEPNHSAGDPILGQIRSADLSNILLVVIRYFGGIKLGVSGLIHAYKTAAADALANASIIEKYETVLLQAHYAYPQMNDVMSLVKEYDLNVREQQFEMDCRLTLEVRKKLQEGVTAKLEAIDGVRVTVLA